MLDITLRPPSDGRAPTRPAALITDAQLGNVGGTALDTANQSGAPFQHFGGGVENTGRNHQRVASGLKHMIGAISAPVISAAGRQLRQLSGRLASQGAKALSISIASAVDGSGVAEPLPAIPSVGWGASGVLLPMRPVTGKPPQRWRACVCLMTIVDTGALG